MKLLILAVGKPKEKRLAALAREYLGRIRPGNLVEAQWVPDARAEAKGAEAAKGREGQELLSRIHPRDRLILLGEEGAEYTSRQFAALLASEMAGTAGRLVFAIGGPWGVSAEVRARADRVLALSRMTFPHEMCFLFLAEQVYRAFSILQGSGYHH